MAFLVIPQDSDADSKTIHCFTARSSSIFIFRFETRFIFLSQRTWCRSERLIHDHQRHFPFISFESLGDQKQKLPNP